MKSENLVCTFCCVQLPKTKFHLHAENPIKKMFWGRANVHSAAAFYFFEKGGKVQNLMHQLKYRGKKELGTLVGNWYGAELKNSESFNSVNLVVPVPLHPNKLKKRGYNQSESFAEGIAKAMEVEIDSTNFIRNVETETQTKKARYKRWENVETVFEVKDSTAFENKHILLVDDVVTTGATLEACAQKLLMIDGTKVSIATMAYAASS